jgi:hypothetical protein
MGALILAPICTQREFLTGGNTAAQITVSEEEVVALGLNVNRNHSAYYRRLSDQKPALKKLQVFENEEFGSPG